MQNSSADAEVKACSVCLEELQLEVVGLPCGHKFHRRCKANLLVHAHLRCPICRAPWHGDRHTDIDSTVITESNGTSHIQILNESNQDAQENLAQNDNDDGNDGVGFDA